MYEGGKEMLYPKLNHKRRVYNLNGIWNFQVLKDEYCPEQKLEKSQPMAVPASYNDIVADKKIMDHVGEVVYERSFSIPVEEGELYRLRIGSASHKCKIYLNGKLIGEGKNGHLPVDCVLEDLQEENRLSVVIDNRLSFQTLPPGMIENGKQIYNHDFYNFTGIHRDVCVYTIPEEHIEDIVIQTVVDGDYSMVKVELTGMNRNPVYTVTDAEGNVVVESTDSVFHIPDVKVWSPKNPYLYTLKVKTDTDYYEETFGVRKVEVRGKEFLLNDEPLYLKGFGMHEDFWVLGKGLSSAVNIANFERLKWVGANSMRTSHYPYSEEFMYLADRYGILVIDEVPAVGMNWWEGGNFTPDRLNETTMELHNELLTDLMARDKNHPCVIMLSVANEAATFEEASRPYFEGVISHARSITDLPIICVEHTRFWDGCLIGDLVDVIGLNRYYGWYEHNGDLGVVMDMFKSEMEDFHEKFGKPILMAEFGADTIEGVHSLHHETFSEEFQLEYLKECRRVFAECDFCIGEHVWNFADFKTKQGMIRVRGNRKGVFTKERQPKMAAHYLRSAWKE